MKDRGDRKHEVNLVLRLESTDAMLAAMATTLPITVERLADGRYVLDWRE